MGYIYCITNVINSKKYIGKTTTTIEERFREHCSDAKKERCNKRPLYDAINKYGIENFVIDLLEEVEDNSILDEREIYWINELLTYGRNGYNATKGGDGKLLFNHEDIIQLHNLGYTRTQIAKKMHCDPTLVSRVIKAHGKQLNYGRVNKINQFDLAGNFILTFVNSAFAGEWLKQHGLCNKKHTAGNAIIQCCKHKRKTAYGYIWQYK